jgi:hypothetical protein
MHNNVVKNTFSAALIVTAIICLGRSFLSARKQATPFRQEGQSALGWTYPRN